jgi:glycosyltransferase involved in cell wall biosynthesis
MRGGVADYTSLLADALAQLGVEVTVLTSKRAAVGERAGDAPVDAVIDNWGIPFWRDIARHIGRYRPDVIHIQYQTGAFDMRIGVNLLPWIYRLRPGRPAVVVTFHDLKEPYLLPKIGPARHLATHALITGADAVVVTNPEDLDRIRGKDVSQTRWVLGSRPIASIPIGSNILQGPGQTDVSQLRDQLRSRPDEAVLAYFGFLGASKGIDDLAEAFRLLVGRNRAVRLLMVGASAGDTGHPDRGFEGAIRRRLDDPSLRGRVSWTGFLAPADVGAYLRSADVCVLPYRDGVSIRHGTLIAAIEHELPIVSTTPRARRGPNPFPPLISGENILLVEPRNPAAVADGIERLISDKPLLAKLAAGSRSLRAAFDWRAIAKANVALYEKVRARA